MNHTPTPWEAKELHQNYEGFVLLHKTDGGLRRVDNKEGKFSKANAQFIVQAVNSYQAMKEALEACRPWIAKAIEMNVQERTVLPMSIMRANALLNKALTLVQGKE